jgi:hypothetical protein
LESFHGIYLGIMRCLWCGVPVLVCLKPDWLLVRTAICAGTLMARVQVMCRLVHSTWQDHILKVAYHQWPCAVRSGEWSTVLIY